MTRANNILRLDRLRQGRGRVLVAARISGEHGFGAILEYGPGLGLVSHHIDRCRLLLLQHRSSWEWFFFLRQFLHNLRKLDNLLRLLSLGWQVRLPA